MLCSQIERATVPTFGTWRSRGIQGTLSVKLGIFTPDATRIRHRPPATAGRTLILAMTMTAHSATCP